VTGRLSSPTGPTFAGQYCPNWSAMEAVAVSFTPWSPGVGARTIVYVPPKQQVHELFSSSTNWPGFAGVDGRSLLTGRPDGGYGTFKLTFDWRLQVSYEPHRLASGLGA
jgi:hypothetical protein